MQTYKYGRDPLYGCLNYELFLFILLNSIGEDGVKSKTHLRYMVFLSLKAAGVEGITPDDF